MHCIIIAMPEQASECIASGKFQSGRVTPGSQADQSSCILSEPSHYHHHRHHHHDIDVCYDGLQGCRQKNRVYHGQTDRRS